MTVLKKLFMLNVKVGAGAACRAPSPATAKDAPQYLESNPS
jgi:hypothetical protein